MLRDPNNGLRRGRIRYFPVVPGRMEFAQRLREELLRERPDIVAVELPVTLSGVYRRAVDRLPELSVIIYDDEGAKQAEPDRAVYLPVEVTDPFVEALRTANEIGAETEFLDPDIGGRPHLEESYPHPYAVEQLGLEKYVGAYRVHPRARSGEAAVHAEGLAWKLQSLDPEASVFVVVSLNLLDPLLEAMERRQTQPLRKEVRRGVRLMNLHPECLAEVLTDMPFLGAVYEARRRGSPPPAPAEVETRAARGGFSIVGAPQVDPGWAAIARAAQEPIDRRKLHFRLFAASERQYAKNTGEEISPWQRRLWARYSRNLALVSNQLLGGLFELSVAARSVVDDNFAWEMWEMAGAYPAQKVDSDLTTANVSGEQMWLNTRLIRLPAAPSRQEGPPPSAGTQGPQERALPRRMAAAMAGTRRLLLSARRPGD